MWNDIIFQSALMDVFDSEEKAFRWLFTPIQTLGNRTPIEMLTEGGQEAVMDVLRKVK